jgi:type II secretory ATPase GspE/PulE/Tfp pilus assembly ATPase PilB-like protein/DNA-binding response OmpR family regulator
METTRIPSILSVDDDPLTQRMIERILTFGGYRVVCAPNARGALEEIQKKKPALIILDVLMPETNGYEFCSSLQENEETSGIPVIFLTILGNDQDKAKALSVGAVDYLMKPIDREILLAKVEHHLQTSQSWQDLRNPFPSFRDRMNPADFTGFKKFLIQQLTLSDPEGEILSEIQPSEVYSSPLGATITPRKMAESIAQFLGVPYRSRVAPADIVLGVLPPGFCQNYAVIPVKGNEASQALVLSNPFDWKLMDSLGRFARQGQPPEIAITEPENIQSLFREKKQKEIKTITILPHPPGRPKSFLKGAEPKADSGVELYPTRSLTDKILESAFAEKASDIHIEPKENDTLVRLRVDGDLKEFLNLEKDIGSQVVSRFKALADMDIAERRKPQDGSVEVAIQEQTFKLRLATTSTPSGESLSIRILDPNQKPKELEDLGLNEEQSRQFADFALRSHGLILLVGPTGSGKTTTIYSLLSQIDCQTRSLISVEDPVEYRIPFANQQQVQSKAGVTFEALLKSSVRQDPNILFIGEIRDPYSAKIAFDFASTGHLTLTTLHTTNATTAIFRLERLEISRGTMAESILGIVAQRLLKRLCPFCKEVKPITPEETDKVGPFADEIPTHTAHPVGCSNCHQTGYRGREGIFEVIHCDSEVVGLIRSGRPIAEIREHVRQRGVQLMSQRSVERVKNLTVSFKDVYEKVLAEENLQGTARRQGKESGLSPAPPKKRRDDPGILIVEDDPTTRKILSHILENEGYRVTLAEDGFDALLKMGEIPYDLILSDIHIPNLDGFKLLELVQQKNFGTPVILMTGSADPEDEIKGLDLGAADYLQKPIKQGVLVFRVRKVLENHLRAETKSALGELRSFAGSSNI